MVCGANSVYCSYAHILNPIILARGLINWGKKQHIELRRGRGNWQSKVPVGWDQGHSFEPLVLETFMEEGGKNGLSVGRKQEVDGIST